MGIFKKIKKYHIGFGYQSIWFMVIGLILILPGTSNLFMKKVDRMNSLLNRPSAGLRWSKAE